MSSNAPGQLPASLPYNMESVHAGCLCLPRSHILENCRYRQLESVRIADVTTRTSGECRVTGPSGIDSLWLTTAGCNPVLHVFSRPQKRRTLGGADAICANCLCNKQAQFLQVQWEHSWCMGAIHQCGQPRGSPARARVVGPAKSVPYCSSRDPASPARPFCYMAKNGFGDRVRRTHGKWHFCCYQFRADPSRFLRKRVVARVVIQICCQQLVASPQFH